ncbi:hypothetical protein CsSME_00034778 [Camellia sinensis var. sinensis]
MLTRPFQTSGEFDQAHSRQSSDLTINLAVRRQRLSTVCASVPLRHFCHKPLGISDSSRALTIAICRSIFNSP